MPAVSRLSQLVAQREGFGLRGAHPTRDHNPGDLEHAPHIESWDGKIGVEPNDDAGWADLERQWRLYAQRGLTLRQAVAIFAPPNENATSEYLDFLCHGLQCDPDAFVADLLEIPAV